VGWVAFWGERRAGVAEKLASPALAQSGYVSFHDVPGDGKWNIDHVVIGPGGIFVLETKARSRRAATRNQEKHKVTFDGRTLQFPWCYDDKVVGQIQVNAQWVRKFIRDFAPAELPVFPIIVVPGWYVETTVRDCAVKAMNALYLERHITGSQPLVGKEQLRAIIRRFDEKCRDVEF
jgi:hypothetical protein